MGCETIWRSTGPSGTTTTEDYIVVMSLCITDLHIWNIILYCLNGVLDSLNQRALWELKDENK